MPLLLAPLAFVATLALLVSDDEGTRTSVAGGRAARTARREAPASLEPRRPSAAGSADGADDASTDRVDSRPRDDDPVPDLAPAALRGSVVRDGRPFAGALRWTLVDGSDRPLATRLVPTDAAGGFEVLLPPGAWDVRPEVADAASLTVRAAVGSGGFHGREPWSRRLLVIWNLRERPDAVPDAPRNVPWAVFDVTTDDLPVWIELASPEALDGRVVDAATGSPLPQAEVRAHDEYGEERVCAVGADGSFRLLAPRQLGTLTLDASAPGYGVQTADWADSSGVAGPGRPVVFRLRPALVLEGRVLDADGQPVPATVEVSALLVEPRDGGYRFGHVWSETCDAEGRFRFDSIPPGAKSGDGTGAGPNAATVSLSAYLQGRGGVGLKELVVTRGGAPLELRLPRVSELTGRVSGPGRPRFAVSLLGRRSLDALSYVCGCGDRVLRFDRSERGLQLDRDGRFQCQSVRFPCVVVADAPGLASRAVVVALGAAAQLELTLRPAAPPIQGRLVRRDGTPLGGVELHAFAHGSRPFRDGGEALDAWLAGLEPGQVREVDLAASGVELDATKTGPDGSFRLDRLPSGPAGFDLFADVRGVDAQVSVAEGVTAGTHGLVLVGDRATTTVRVRVVGADGRPIDWPGFWAEGPDTWLPVEDRRDPPLPPDEDEDGVPDGPEAGPFFGDWVLTLPAVSGDVRLGVNAFDGEAADVRTVRVAAGATVDLERWVLTRTFGDLSLRVTWPEGPAPIVEARWRDPTFGACSTTLESPGSPGEPSPLGRVRAGDVRLTLSVRPRGGGPAREVSLQAHVRVGETTVLDVDLR